MDTKILIIAVIENESGEILMRKKPDGSPPYKETWYLFGAELIPGLPLDETLRAHALKQTGIETEMVQAFDWDTEVKADIDGITKQFIYLDVKSRYKSGNLKPASGIDRLEWIPRDELAAYDLVPPARKLFQKLEYLDK